MTVARCVVHAQLGEHRGHIFENLILFRKLRCEAERFVRQLQTLRVLPATCRESGAAMKRNCLDVSQLLVSRLNDYVVQNGLRLREISLREVSVGNTNL